jgi:hypothetical protein
MGGETQVSYPIMNEWGGAWGGSQPGEGGLVLLQATYTSPKLFPLLACLIIQKNIGTN